MYLEHGRGATGAVRRSGISRTRRVYQSRSRRGGSRAHSCRSLGGFSSSGYDYILGHGKTVIYEDYNVGLELDKPIAQIFSIRSLVSLGIFVVAAIVLRYLRIGRDIRAIGGDRRAARVAGVPVDRLLVGVFVISALGAALSGALLSYSLATASPTNIGVDVLTFSATAALIGGVSLSGGKGGAIGIAAICP
jgi:ribose/xylose/arabinose/galactoside ABC-type transport system permease subunit